MEARRYDTWTVEEDRLLAEIVLEHIRSGSTQLKAFEEVARKLARTAAACGFRWNSLVREKYKDDISEAKKARKIQPKQVQIEKSAYRQAEPVANAKRFSTQEIIQYLLEMEEVQSKVHTVTDDKLKRENEELKDQLAKANTQLKKLGTEYRRLKHNYSSLLNILEKASEVAALDREEPRQKTKTPT